MFSLINPATLFSGVRLLGTVLATTLRAAGEKSAPIVREATGIMTRLPKSGLTPTVRAGAEKILGHVPKLPFSPRQGEVRLCTSGIPEGLVWNPTGAPSTSLHSLSEAEKVKMRNWSQQLETEKDVLTQALRFETEGSNLHSAVKEALKAVSHNHRAYGQVDGRRAARDLPVLSAETAAPKSKKELISWEETKTILFYAKAKQEHVFCRTALMLEEEVRALKIKVNEGKKYTNELGKLEFTTTELNQQITELEEQLKVKERDVLEEFKKAKQLSLTEVLDNYFRHNHFPQQEAMRSKVVATLSIRYLSDIAS